jgi:hypothetical protein
MTSNAPAAILRHSAGQAAMIIISIPFAIGNFFLARRIDGGSPVLWLVLSIIPIVNFLFIYYVGYKVVFTVLDHLRALGGCREAGA